MSIVANAPAPRARRANPISEQEQTKMRKLIWSGTAMVLLMAGGMYFAASYAAQNPDSFLGRCARTLAGMSPTRSMLVCADKPTDCVLAVAEPAADKAAPEC